MNSIAVVAVLHSEEGGCVCFPMTSLFSVLVVLVLRGCLHLGQQVASLQEIWSFSRTFYSTWVTDGCLNVLFTRQGLALMKNKLRAVTVSHESFPP